MLYKVKYRTTNANNERITLNMIVEAVSLTDIEAKVSNEERGKEYEIISVGRLGGEFSKRNGSEVGTDGVFSVSYVVTTIDEVSAKEKKSRSTVYFLADDLDEAAEYFDEYSAPFVSDIERVGISKTSFHGLID